MSSEDAPYVPSDWGARFHSLTTDEALGAGAAGPGKSVVLLMDPLDRIALEHERCNDPEHPFHVEWGESSGWALHLRRTSPMLNQTIKRAKLAFPRIDPGVRWNENDGIFTFSSGYKIQFDHCKDPDDWQRFMSNEYDHIAYDELVQFNKEQYDQINTRLRSSDPLLRQILKIRAMSNPTMDRENMDSVSVNNPHWVRDYFVKPCVEGGHILFSEYTDVDGEKFERTRIYLRATIDDNPDKEFAKKYRRNLLTKPAHIRQALLYGNWFITVGSYFGEVWREHLHTCRPFKIPQDWRLWRSMDWGFKAPGCVHWYAMDPEENVFVIREYTFRNKSATEVAKRIKQIEEDELDCWAGRRSGIAGAADTQLWEKRGTSGSSMAEEMMEVGVGWVAADKLNRGRNAVRVYEKLETDGMSQPGLVIFNTCTRLIETLPALQTDKDDVNVPADGGDDHWCDSLFYGVAFASHGIRGIPRRKFVDEWANDDDKARRSGDRGRYGYGSRAC